MKVGVESNQQKILADKPDIKQYKVLAELHQQGGILLILVVIITTGSSLLWFYSQAHQRADQQLLRASKPLEQLNQIKQLLLVYAASHPELYRHNNVVPGPGYFPCPSTRVNAGSGTHCHMGSAQIAIGWLPRKFGTDGGEVNLEANTMHWRRILFVLDMRFSNRISILGCSPLLPVNGRCQPLNAEVNPDRLSLNGELGYVALLIDAGVNLAGQHRSDQNFAVTDYLELENSDGDGDFVSLRPGVRSNDRVVGIHYQDWLQMMRARISLDLQQGWCVEPPDGSDTDTQWYLDNLWHQDSILQQQCIE